MLSLVNNPHSFPLIASVYGTSYAEFLDLPIDVFTNLITDWQMSVGIKSGTEVFNVASKHWSTIISSNFDRVVSKTPDSFLKALKAAKKRLGTDKVSMKEVFKSMEEINK
jgi:hypothetical protein